VQLPHNFNFSFIVALVHTGWSQQSVSLRFSVSGGSSSESAAQKGAAHVLAVSGFTNGTVKRSGLRLIRDLENVGAVISSSVDREKVS